MVLTTRPGRRLRVMAKRVRAALAPGPVILLYHRVATLESDPQALAVTPERFAEHLEVLREHARLISLSELADRLGKGRPPRRAVAITFDDGYVDNLLHAKPLLERYASPATVFVSSGYVGRRMEFWWDELERVLLRPPILPEALALTIRGIEYDWSLQSTVPTGAGTDRKSGEWNVLHVADPGPRHHVYRTLTQLLRPLEHQERLDCLVRLAEWSDSGPDGRDGFRAVSKEELCRLAAGGLVDIGAHTITHPTLSAIPPEQQRIEIEWSKYELEEVLGREVTSFSYPFGNRGSYTAETVAAVREAGFVSACSNFPGRVRGSDLYQLPRVLVRNWDGDTFARHLRSWFDV